MPELTDLSLKFRFIFKNNNKEHSTQALRGENNNSANELFRIRSMLKKKKKNKINEKSGKIHESSRQKQEYLLASRPLSLVLS